MKHPHRDVNGSGRILYRTITNKWEYPSNRTTQWSVGGSCMEKVPVPTFGPYVEGVIGEWSPSGDYLKINQVWHKADEVELVEVLPQ